MLAGESPGPEATVEGHAQVASLVHLALCHDCGAQQGDGEYGCDGKTAHGSLPV
jgi:hypothetical protein